MELLNFSDPNTDKNLKSTRVEGLISSNFIHHHNEHY